MSISDQYLPWPRWVSMWGLSIALYLLLKVVAFQLRKPGRAERWRQWAFLVGWPGMNADTFLLTPAQQVSPPSRSEWLLATVKFLLGIGLVVSAIRFSSTIDPYVVGWIGMVGIVFTLHFGQFHLLSCGWRACGIAATPIMNWPIASQSVAEFWGQRWNLAFRDLTHRMLFQPLRRPLGPTGALFTGFLVSGLVHDLVISVPAGGGYGWPTAYFMLQSVGIVLERSRTGRRLGLGRGPKGRVFCLGITLLPVGWLMHRPFATAVIVPFLRALGCAP